MDIRVIIPAYNEADSIALVIGEIPEQVNEIIVCDNGSTDETAQRAREAGAVVVNEDRKGYGFACLRGLEYLALEEKKPDIVVFLDGDYSDYPEEMNALVAPIIDGLADFTLGARVPEFREPGSMTPQQVFGNALATVLMRWLFGSRFTDLGPFRAIRYPRLLELDMQDKTYGWTVEMQLKVLRRRIPYIEIPVHYKKRIGHSKVSGTLKGTIFAGIKILTWIFRYSLG